MVKHNSTLYYYLVLYHLCQHRSGLAGSVSSVLFCVFFVLKQIGILEANR
eukprot:UN02378